MRTPSFILMTHLLLSLSHFIGLLLYTLLPCSCLLGRRVSSFCRLLYNAPSHILDGLAEKGERQGGILIGIWGEQAGKCRGKKYS